jgi:hypothetical protein
MTASMEAWKRMRQGAHSSIREKAFASGQSFADYCNFKVETERKR